MLSMEILGGVVERQDVLGAKLPSPLLKPKHTSMNIENFREYCLQKASVTEELPFDDITLVFKVLGKMRPL